jgi:DNA-binding HxlR family transcriptional regulator
MSFDLKEWEEIQPLIKKTRETIRKLFEKHFERFDHDADRKVGEIQAFLQVIRFITRKWTVEVLYELEIHNGLIFNDLKRHLGDVSSRTLSDCLKMLQKQELIQRTIQETRPPSVFYELTDGGKGFVEISMLLIMYLAELKIKK